jgi:hypothetical protein
MASCQNKFQYIPAPGGKVVLKLFVYPYPFFTGALRAPQSHTPLADACNIYLLLKIRVLPGRELFVGRSNRGESHSKLQNILFSSPAFFFLRLHCCPEQHK